MLRPTAPLVHRLPTGGRLELHPGHSFTHCFWPGVDQYEPDVRAALLHLLKPGDTFVDCGANIGYFSVLATGLVGPHGRVVAIEANPQTFELLKRNLALNGCGTPVHCAVTTNAGEVDIFVSDMGDVYSSLRTGGLVTGDSVRSYKVPGRPLDEVVEDLGLDRVHVVKVDIEGGELDVLRSARRTMTQLRPVWIVEYGTNTWPAFGATAEQLLALVKDRGYEIRQFDLSARRLVAPLPNVWQSPYTNIMLLPNEKIGARE
jgi:FkbM family methyltransferase